MLDLSHPMAEHIIAASHMEDFLMVKAQSMTVLPSKKRILLLADCFPVLDELRRLNDEHFEASPFTSRAIDEAQAALEQIAHLKGDNIEEDRSDGEGDCPACGTPITKYEVFPDKSYGRRIVLCRRCYEPFTNAKGKLHSLQGFRTCAI